MNTKGLMAASTKPLILAIICSQKSYGYEIIQKVKMLSGGTLTWKDGMLYPVLHKLEKDGLITSEWIITKDNSKRRKYYSITEAGKEEINVEKKAWLNVHNILTLLWDSPELKTAIQ